MAQTTNPPTEPTAPDPHDHPALARLELLDAGRDGTPPRPARVTSRPPSSAPSLPRMGYQPTLDGVRAFSVIAVIFYHAGFSWMHGGFFGVEVFFAVSGFLITSLLIEERDGSERNGLGTIRLGQFWLRRARRLLPALFAMLILVGVWGVFWGSTEQAAQLRRDFPWGVFYVANWGQIFSDVPYFAPTPPLFRHLWSLAVEEQWYLIWPLVFLLIARRRVNDRRVGRTLGIFSLCVMSATALMYAVGWPTKWPFLFSLDPSQWGMRPVNTTNFLYLSTFTRCSGLVLGASLAFLWRPWRTVNRPYAVVRPSAAAPLAPRSRAGRSLDLVALVAVALLTIAFVTGRVASMHTYAWMLPMVTLASTALIGVAVHPWAAGTRTVFAWRPLVEVGKRSYGLYLWSWPISRIVGGYHGSWSKFALAMAITIPVNEVCYRYIETPIRRGGLGVWWHNRSRHDWTIITGCAVASTVAIAASMALYYGNAPAVFDPARDTGNEEVAFDAGVVGTSTSGATVPSETTPVSEPGASVVATQVPTTVGATVPVTAASLPRRVVIVGDSTAHSIAINLPSGIESTFAIGDGSVEGCSVYSEGKAVSSRDGFTRSFGGCDGWDQRWANSAATLDADVALVVLGAWDVFDVESNGQVLPFGSVQNDQRFLAGVQRGIDALSALGTKVALLEVPCMRPQDVKGAGVPALPERGDDARVAHVNDLLRQLAAANPATTVFVTGPPQYCADPTIASDLAYRWDGVHAYKPGAKLTFEAIANSLLSIPVT